MFENVLVGVDGRPGGRDAVALASRLVVDGGRLTLVNVHTGAPRSVHTQLAAVATTTERDSTALLQREREACDVEAQLVSFTASSPGHGLHVLAERDDADLIVVGSCSRGALGRAMLGDDARASLNGAPCAVAIAARGYGDHPTPIATIGVGYDGSPESEQALAAARAVALRNRSLIRALEVVTLPTYAFAGAASAALGESIDAMLQEARERLDKLDRVEGEAVYGMPGEELDRFGAEVDLLVVGSRSYGPVKRLMLGSTSNHLQRCARCSLLVLPRGTAAVEASESSREQYRAFPQAAIAPER